MEEGNINGRLATVEAEVDNLKSCYITLTVDIKEIKEKLLSRPSWFIAIIITALVTLSTSLIIYIVTLK